MTVGLKILQSIFQSFPCLTPHLFGTTLIDFSLNPYVSFPEAKLLGVGEVEQAVFVPKVRCFKDAHIFWGLFDLVFIACHSVSVLFVSYHEQK